MRRVAVPADAFPPGTMLAGKIRVERVVGHGSSGIVLEGIDLPLQRRVAVKVLAPERAASEEHRKRFLREARAAARLSSQHIRRLIDVGELEDGTPFLVMEYLDGTTLEGVLLTEGPPAIDVAVDWVMQALDGIAEAHRAGLVHRDIKPENLFLAERPDRPPIVKVLDFGAVKDLVTKATKLTRHGSTMGSPAYMPPEQVRAEEIDRRADVWALGVTLHELVTGRLPFGGENLQETLTAILRDDPVPMSSLRPGVPPDLDDIVARALSKDPADRYASGTELLGALSVARARIPTLTPQTRTVRLPSPHALPAGGLTAYGETAELSGAGGADASQIRPRVPVEAFARGHVAAAMPALVPTRRADAFRPALVGATLAIAIGSAAGAALLHRYPRVTPPEAAPAPAVASQPPASTAIAPLPAPPPTGMIVPAASTSTGRGGVRPVAPRKPHPR